MPPGAARPPRSTAPTRRPAVLCPRCGSHRVAPDLAFIDGARYHCKDCDFRGAFVVTGIGPAEPDAPPKGGPA